MNRKHNFFYISIYSFFLSFYLHICLTDCRAENKTAARGKVILSDIKKTPALWTKTAKNFINQNELILFAGTTAAAITAWQFNDEITDELQNTGFLKGNSSLGDTYGNLMSNGIPQTSAYLVGNITKNNTIREFGLLATHSMIITGILSQTLKFITNSDRPDGSSGRRLNSSFPSAHASGAASLAGMVQHRYGTAYASVFHLLAAYTGLTRVTDNRHRPYEVIAGLGLGYIVGYAVSEAWDTVKPNTDHYTIKPWIKTDNKKGVGLTLRIDF